MNHSVNRSVNDSRRKSCAVQCPIHWGNGREWKGMEFKIVVLKSAWHRPVTSPRVRHDAMQVES